MEDRVVTFLPQLLWASRQFNTVLSLHLLITNLVAAIHQHEMLQCVAVAAWNTKNFIGEIEKIGGEIDGMIMSDYSLSQPETISNTDITRILFEMKCVYQLCQKLNTLTKLFSE
jgi:hypothetical protein